MSVEFIIEWERMTQQDRKLQDTVGTLRTNVSMQDERDTLYELFNPKHLRVHQLIYDFLARENQEMLESVLQSYLRTSSRPDKAVWVEWVKNFYVLGMSVNKRGLKTTILML